MSEEGSVQQFIGELDVSETVTDVLASSLGVSEDSLQSTAIADVVMAE